MFFAWDCDARIVWTRSIISSYSIETRSNSTDSSDCNAPSSAASSAPGPPDMTLAERARSICRMSSPRRFSRSARSRATGWPRPVSQGVPVSIGILSPSPGSLWGIEDRHGRIEIETSRKPS